MEISLEDTAVGRKKSVLEQQLNATALSRQGGVVGAAEEVIGSAKGV